MKALQIQQLGSLDDIEIVEIDSPDLLPGHIRVAVLASGLNYVDSLMIEGKYQIKPPVPYRPGSEIVGRVVEVASDVTHLKIGDRVFSPSGGFADEAVLSASRVIAIPDQLSDGQGATFMQSYLTAWFAFHKRAQVREGATMLVLGAGGGVGLAAVDLGVAMGMRVIAAASSPEKRQLALDRGAFAAIDVLNEDVKLRTRELCGGGVDMVYDPVGGDLAEPCLRALAPFGQYLVVGFVGGIPRLPANHVLLTNRTVVGVDWGAWVGRNVVVATFVLSALHVGTDHDAKGPKVRLHKVPDRALRTYFLSLVQLPLRNAQEKIHTPLQFGFLASLRNNHCHQCQIQHRCRVV
jgi:NADPH2:quinone reductase